jgi:predicted nucleic acid-binding protein
MIVVSDTSPLNYLVLLGEIEVLPKLFDQIHTTAGVIGELLDPGAPEAVARWARQLPAWLQIGAPRELTRFTRDLDQGEAEAISLAMELHAAAVLIDEKTGRRIAQLQGLATIGTVTTLELAARENLLDLKKAFEALARTSFHFRQSYFDEALTRDAARKRDTNR